MKTVALVGMAHTTRDLAPWDNKDIEIWTLNESPARRFGYVKRVSRHFQLHPYWNFMREGNQNDPEHAEWLKVQTFPIYTQEVYEDIPASVKYPLDEIFDFFGLKREGPDHWKEFTSTFPYMLALAAYEGFDRIEAYGFEMGSETEYSYQRPSVHLWLGILRGMYLTTGKPEIYIPDGAKLLGWHDRLYGYEMVMGLNPMEIEIDRNKYGNQAKQLEQKMLEIEGAQGELKRQMEAIQQSFDARAREVQDKKQDIKLTRKRLQELEGELKRAIAPYQMRFQELQQEKIKMWEIKARLDGGHLAMQELLDRYNSQMKPTEKLTL